MSFVYAAFLSHELLLAFRETDSPFLSCLYVDSTSRMRLLLLLALVCGITNETAHKHPDWFPVSVVLFVFGCVSNVVEARRLEPRGQATPNDSATQAQLMLVLSQGALIASGLLFAESTYGNFVRIFCGLVLLRCIAAGFAEIDAKQNGYAEPQLLGCISDS